MHQKQKFRVPAVEELLRFATRRRGGEQPDTEAATAVQHLAMPAGTSMPPPTRPRTLDPGDARGTALALLSAVGLGLAVAVARYAYEGGANGLTVVAVRSLVLVAGLFVYCRATGRSLGLRRARTAGVARGSGC